MSGGTFYPGGHSTLRHRAYLVWVHTLGHPSQEISIVHIAGYVWDIPTQDIVLVGTSQEISIVHIAGYVRDIPTQDIVLVGTSQEIAIVHIAGTYGYGIVLRYGLGTRGYPQLTGQVARVLGHPWKSLEVLDTPWDHGIC